jgi:orotidine-5'-phosphate decarboxylase
MNFTQKLKAAQQRNRSALCVALDIIVANSPLPILYSDEPMLPFARAVIDATKDLVCAYKVNLAYFFAEGAAGMVALERVTRLIPNDVPLILEVNCAEVGRTGDAYARGAFAQFNADAAMVWAYGREDAMEAFMAYPGKLAFFSAPAEEPAYTYRWLSKWQKLFAGAFGVVAHPNQWQANLKFLRERLPDVPFLLQAMPADEDAGEAMRLATTHEGVLPVVCVGEPVIYASRRADFEEAARAAANAFRLKLRV